ncbi:unnamed protein product, partial [marine sediment metagenome]
IISDLTTKFRQKIRKTICDEIQNQIGDTKHATLQNHATVLDVWSGTSTSPAPQRKRCYF